MNKKWKSKLKCRDWHWPTSRYTSKCKCEWFSIPSHNMQHNSLFFFFFCWPFFGNRTEPITISITLLLWGLSRRKWINLYTSVAHEYGLEMFGIPNICEIIFIWFVCVQYVSGWSARRVMPNNTTTTKAKKKTQPTCLLRYKLFDDRMKIRWNKIQLWWWCELNSTNKMAYRAY